MTNGEIAGALEELGTLYELDGAVRYRVNAYREAARVVRQSPVSVEERSQSIGVCGAVRERQIPSNSCAGSAGAPNAVSPRPT